MSTTIDESLSPPLSKPTETAAIFSGPLRAQVIEGMDIKEKKRQLYIKDRELTQLQQEAVQRQQALNTEIEAAHQELARREGLLQAFKAAHGQADETETQDGKKSQDETQGQDEDDGHAVRATPGLRMAKNSIIYQQEVHRLSNACTEQQAKLEELIKSGHAELRRRDAEITRRAADLKDRQADLVASQLGIDDERQRELVELLDKTRAWEQAVGRDVERLQQQLRDAQKQTKIWKAKFQLRSDELTAAQQIAEVHAAGLAAALDTEREKNDRLTADYKVALARGIDAVKAEASRVISQTRRDLVAEYEAKITALRHEHDQELLAHRSLSTGDRHAFEKKLRDQQEAADQRLEAAKTDLTNYYNEVIAQLRADASAKQSELEIRLDEERGTSQRQRDQAQAMADKLMQERVVYYETKLEEQKQSYEAMLEEQRGILAQEKADREAERAAAAAVLAARLEEMEQLREAFDAYKLTVYEEDLKNRTSLVEAINRVRELESYEIHRARTFAVKLLLDARPNFGFEVDFMKGSVKVKSVVPNGPACALGLKQGDTIVQANGLPIKAKPDFAKVVKATRLGTVLKLTYTRGGSGEAAQKEVALPVATKYFSVPEIVRLQRVASGIISPIDLPTAPGQSITESDGEFVDRMFKRVFNAPPEFPPINDPASVVAPVLLGNLPPHASTSTAGTIDYGEMRQRRPEAVAAFDERMAQNAAAEAEAQAKKNQEYESLESTYRTSLANNAASSSTAYDHELLSTQSNLTPPSVAPLPADDDDEAEEPLNVPAPPETEANQPQTEVQIEVQTEVSQDSQEIISVQEVPVSPNQQEMTADDAEISNIVTNSKVDQSYEQSYTTTIDKQFQAAPDQIRLRELANTDDAQYLDVITDVSGTADGQYGDSDMNQDFYPAPPGVTIL